MPPLVLAVLVLTGSTASAIPQRSVYIVLADGVTRSITVGQASVEVATPRGSSGTAAGGEVGVQTSEALDRITATIEPTTPLPSNVTLAVRITSLTCLNSCQGAAGNVVSPGSYISLSTTAEPIATEVGPVWAADAIAVLSYQLTATASASLGSGSSTVVLTIGA